VGNKKSHLLLRAGAGSYTAPDGAQPYFQGSMLHLTRVFGT